MDTRSYEEKAARGSRDKTKVEPWVDWFSMCTVQLKETKCVTVTRSNTLSMLTEALT